MKNHLFFVMQRKKMYSFCSRTTQPKSNRPKENKIIALILMQSEKDLNSLREAKTNRIKTTTSFSLAYHSTQLYLEIPIFLEKEAREKKMHTAKKL